MQLGGAHADNRYTESAMIVTIEITLAPPRFYLRLTKNRCQVMNKKHTPAAAVHKASATCTTDVDVDEEKRRSRCMGRLVPTPGLTDRRHGPPARKTHTAVEINKRRHGSSECTGLAEGALPFFFLSALLCLLAM